MAKALKVSVAKCIACSACVSICPKSFTLDEKDYDAVTVAINPQGDNESDIKLAIKACPTKAITYK